ncbi:MAG TPA: 3'-5' exoribonuclease [Gammaproteobacteria bacterium]|nr:3'-5' exoribonuclease [Gammaproteobacteria bacterium]
MQLPEIYVSTDIETDGWTPGKNSMLSLGSAAFLADKTLLDTFTVNLETLPNAVQEPATLHWWNTQPVAFEACRRDCQPPATAMQKYQRWLKQLPGKIIFVAYPAAFDFNFVNYYLQRFVGENPFGFAVIDIRSYVMGMQNLPYRKAGKNHYPAEWFDNLPHTHIALDDALEQGSLFCNILKANQQLSS